MRLLVPAFFGTALFIVWVYAILDIIATDAMFIRNLPKMAWLFLVILVPGVGAIAWLALGRPLHAGWAPGDTRTRQPRRFVAPEDREDWRPPPSGASRPDPSRIDDREQRLRKWEADLERRERELGNDG